MGEGMEIVGDKIAMWFDKAQWHFANEEGVEIAHHSFKFRGEGIDLAGISLSRKVILMPSWRHAVITCSNKGDQVVCHTKDLATKRRDDIYTLRKIAEEHAGEEIYLPDPVKKGHRDIGGVIQYIADMME